MGHLHFSLQGRLRSEGHPIPSMPRLVWKCALLLMYIGVNDEWLGGWGRGELIKILRPGQRVCRELTWWWWMGLRVSKQVLSFLWDGAFGETHADPLACQDGDTGQSSHSEGVLPLSWAVAKQKGISYWMQGLGVGWGAPCQPPLVSLRLFPFCSPMQSPFARLLF